MKKIIFITALLISNISFAENNCNQSKIIINNKTNDILTVVHYNSQVYFPEEEPRFDIFGKLKAIETGLAIKPNQTQIIHAQAKSRFEDILQNIVLSGEHGIIDIDITFKTTYWRNTNCRASVDIISTQVPQYSFTNNGIPATINVVIGESAP